MKTRSKYDPLTGRLSARLQQERVCIQSSGRSVRGFPFGVAGNGCAIFISGINGSHLTRIRNVRRTGTPAA